MKTRFFLAGIFSLALLSMHAQNVQSDSLATSGGLEAGVTASGPGRNTFYGYQAGKLNNSGTYNSFFGQGAGRMNTSGHSNVFNGAYAGQSNTTGSSNTLIGSAAGESNNGFANVFIGARAGFDSSGNNNIFLGVYCGGETTGSNNVFIGNQVALSENTNDKLFIDNSNTLTPLIWGDFGLDQLKLNAKVGIGGVTTFPTVTAGISLASYKLFVKGGILADEVRVSTTWADYVFAKGYQLPTLAEVEDHIKTKGHLIHVPSAAQIEAEGMEVGQMAKIQQEKIEELTLYLIEQNRINAQQAQEIAALKKDVRGFNR